MTYTKISVWKAKNLRKKVKALYLEAFPREERLPFFILLWNARRKGIDLDAWLADGKFCAMTASVTVEDLHFLLFFAVDAGCRGCGHGSGVLQQLRSSYDTVVLNVEPLLEDAPNLEQRKRRFAFYGRNGLVDTGYHVWEVGGMFRVLSTTPQLDVHAYRKIFKKLTFGLWKVRLEEERRS